jgi:HlyD family secretion protein
MPPHVQLGRLVKREAQAAAPASIRDTSATDRPVVSRRVRLTPWLVTGVVLLVLAALLVLATRWQRQASMDGTVSRAALRLAVVGIGDVTRELNAQGRVIAAASPTLYSPAPGVVSYRVQAGDSVKEGDLLAQVDSPTLANELQQEQASLGRQEQELARAVIAAKQLALANQQGVELAKVDLIAAEREWRRAQDSFGVKKVINEIDYEKARDELARAKLRHKQSDEQATLALENSAYERQGLERELERQRLRVAELQRKVDGLSVRSPVTGMIGSLALAQTSAVIAQQPLLTVVDLTRFAVEVSVPESYADDLGLALPVIIRIGAQDYPGAVAAIAPEVIQNEVIVRLRFTGDTPANLRQNQRLTARIELENRPGVLSVARGAFVDADQGRSAFLVEGDSARRVPIRIGALGLDRVEILDGLKSGDAIIVSDTSEYLHQKQLLITD